MVKGIHIADESYGSVLPQAWQVAPDRSKTGRIIVVFDPAEQDHELISGLEKAGYQVEACTQIETLQSCCDTGEVPIAVILDFPLNKGGDGMAVNLFEIRAKCRKAVPLICLSPQKKVAIRLAAYRMGATHYLVKPFDIGVLLNQIEEAKPPADLNQYRVMLVDDESPQLHIHAEILRKAGMSVYVEGAPLRVADALEQFDADVLVVGMEMAECSGLELAIVLHDDPRYAALPVVYLSRESRILLQTHLIEHDELCMGMVAAPSQLIEAIGRHARNYRRSVEKAENLRRARYELLRQQQALDSHAIVSLTDVSGNIVYVNEKFCEISGYRSDELIGKNHRIIKSGLHPDALYADMWRTISGGDIWHGEVCNRCKNGDFYWVYTSIVPFLDANGLPYQYISIRTDITHVKESEVAMLRAKEAAEAGSRAKSEFLASMSHELRTPLNAILGFSQLFTLDESLPQKTRNNSRQIELAGQHLLSLVNDMIDLARIESNKMELSMEAIAVEGVMEESVSMVQTMARNNNISVELVQCGMPGLRVRGDYNRLRQSMINLLTNGIKYNRDHGTVRMVCEPVDGRVRIAVTDSGAGIPPELQGRIFNAFDRLGEERGEVEGTGIGLVITKRLMEAMGGSIGFVSTQGQGSTFWLELPLVTDSDAPHQKPEADPVGSETAQPVQGESKRRSVLYVEDNQMNLRLMKQIFAGRQEWVLHSAANAEAGLEMARSSPPDLILMDINLPGMDGYQALSKLKSYPDTAHIPVVALTANAMKGDRERGLEAGFADYLTKPLDVIRLLEMLGKLLA